MNTTPIICSGNDLEGVLAGIRDRGGFVASLETRVGKLNGQYRVNYFERAEELAPQVAVRQSVDGTYCQQVNNPAALTSIPISPIDASSGTSQMKPASERFWSKVNKYGPIIPSRPELGSCWIWIPSIGTNYYGVFWDGVKQVKAFVWAHRSAHGEIAEGFERHHICENKQCVNPNHIEVLTRRDHQLRHMTLPFAVNASKTQCIHGHELTEDNVYRDPATGNRKCIACRRVASHIRVLNGTSHRHIPIAPNAVGEQSRDSLILSRTPKGEVSAGHITTKQGVAAGGETRAEKPKSALGAPASICERGPEEDPMVALSGEESDACAGMGCSEQEPSALIPFPHQGAISPVSQSCTCLSGGGVAPPEIAGRSWDAGLNAGKEPENPAGKSPKGSDQVTPEELRVITPASGGGTQTESRVKDCHQHSTPLPHCPTCSGPVTQGMPCPICAGLKRIRDGARKMRNRFRSSTRETRLPHPND